MQDPRQDHGQGYQGGAGAACRRKRLEQEHLAVRPALPSETVGGFYLLKTRRVPVNLRRAATPPAVPCWGLLGPLAHWGLAGAKFIFTNFEIFIFEC